MKRVGQIADFIIIWKFDFILYIYRNNYRLQEKRMQLPQNEEELIQHLGKQYSLFRSASRTAILMPIMALLILTFCSPKADFSDPKTSKTYPVPELHFDGKRSEELGKPLATHYTSSGEPFTGTQKVYHSDSDSLHMKMFFEDGINTGSVIYDEDGDVTRQKHGRYLNGPYTREIYDNEVLVYQNIPPTESEDGMGHLRGWHENGQLSVEVSYTGDQVYQGLLTEYDEEGNVIKQERYEDGELVETIK